MLQGEHLGRMSKHECCRKNHNADSGLVGSWFDEYGIKNLEDLDILQYEEIKDLSNAAGRTFRENVKR